MVIVIRASQPTEVTMTMHSMTQTTPGRTALGVPGTLLDRPLERLLALVHEWWTRREIERSLGCLPNFYLHEIGLTKADVEAACADSYSQSASRALERAAQNRRGNR
jgi:uncharacterized protein YjiS (DUF1127 family)